MNLIKREAIVPYSSRQMFELVNAIEDYPRFLPWCSASQILHCDNEKIEAELQIVWSGIHKSFATRNYLHPYHQIQITLIHGPFRHLKGRWSFTEIGEHQCKVELELEFEFAGRWVDKMFQPIFQHIANSLVDLFCHRAVELYGNH